MSFENQNQIERKEKPYRLEDYLDLLNNDNIKTLPLENIKKTLEKIGTANITNEYCCGIRISKMPTGEYKTWTTNELEDMDHPITRKYRDKIIIID
jgi:hypothetical protein